MKRISFIFLAILLSVIFGGLMVRSSNVSEKSSNPLGTITTLFWSGTEEWVLSGSGEVFSSSGETRWFRLQSVGPIDMVLSPFDAPAAKISLEAKKNTILLGKGVYLLCFSDLFGKGEVRFESFTIDPLSEGIFFVDTRNPIVRIYSITALLRTTLVSGEKNVTEFNIFPSTLFLYDPEQNKNLENADIFRISQINTLKTVDLHEEDATDIISPSERGRFDILFQVYRRFVANRNRQFQRLSAQFDPKSFESELALFDKYSLFFQNPKKKRIILQNSLISSLQQILLLEEHCDAACEKTKDTLIKKHVGAVSSHIESLGGISDAFAEDGKGIVKQYVILSTLSTQKRENSYFESGKSPILALTESVFDRSAFRDGRYRLLSQIYSSYFVSNGTKKDFEINLKHLVQTLIDGKWIRERDFISFVFFLKGYLTLHTVGIEANTLDVAVSMIQIGDEYLSSLKEESAKFSALSVLYHHYNQIAETIRLNTLLRFFTGSEEDLLLREEYRKNESTANIPPDFTSSFSSFTATLGKSLDANRSEFYRLLWVRQGDVTDSFVVLSKTNDSLLRLKDIFANYAEYRKNLSLSEGSKNAMGIVQDKGALSEEKLSSYLSRFDGVDVSTLEIKNDFRKDGYYSVAVKIFELPFWFYLRESGHVLENLEFQEASGTLNTSFKQATLALDEREKILRDSFGGAETPEDRERFDFKKIFKNLFIAPKKEEAATSATPSGPENIREMDPAVLVTVQRELVKKDFTNIEPFASVSVKNIYAEIRDGAYDIDLFDISVSSPGISRNYRALLSGKYLFTSDTHAFAKLKLKVSKEEGSGYEFDGASVSVFPDSIPLLSFVSEMSKFWKYLDVIRREAQWRFSQLEIHLDSRSVMIDGNFYPVTLE